MMLRIIFNLAKVNKIHCTSTAPLSISKQVLTGNIVYRI